MNPFYFYFASFFFMQTAQSSTTESIATTLDARSCQVSFFESWSSYSHPVKPARPLFLEQIFQREKYCRAWTCGEGSQQKILLFESISNEITPLALSETVGIFKPMLERDVFQVGAPLHFGDLLKTDPYSYIAIWLNRDGQKQSSLIKQTLNYRYHYHYRPDGTLLKVVITNADGAVNTLEY